MPVRVSLLECPLAAMHESGGGTSGSTSIFFVRELRNFLLIFLIGCAILIAVDRIWFGGQYFGVAQEEFGLDFSAVRRR
jgi:hypothetical protein